jgi:hypothetical protein
MVERTTEPPEYLGDVSDKELMDRTTALRLIDRMHRDSIICDETWRRLRNEITPGIGSGEPAGEKIRANNIKRWREQNGKIER